MTLEYLLITSLTPPLTHDTQGGFSAGFHSFRGVPGWGQSRRSSGGEVSVGGFLRKGDLK